MSRKVRPQDLRNFFLLFLLGAAYFLFFFFMPFHRLLHNDDAIGGLAALHILKGSFPVFFYGQSYMGSLDFFIAAPLFLLLGVSSWAFRLAYLPFWLVFLLFSYRWTRELTDSRGAVFALLYALFPSATVMICIGRGGYTVLLALGIYLLYLAHRLTLQGKEEVRLTEVFFSGLVGGLIFWNDFLGVSYILLALLLIFWPRKKRLFGPPGAAAALGFFLGSLPFWAWNKVYQWESLRAMVGLSGGKTWVELGALAWKMFTESFPSLLGYGAYAIQGPPWLKAATGGLALVVTGYALWRIIFIRDSRRKSLVWMLLFALMVIGLFLLGQQPGVPRYLLPFYSVFPTLLGILLWDLHRRIRWLAWGVLPFLILLSVHDVFLLYTARFEDLRLPVSALIRFMQENGVRAGYAHSSYGHPLTFEAREQIVFADPSGFRIPHYLEWVDARTIPVSYLAKENTPMYREAVRGMLGSLAAEFREKRIGDFTLFYDLRRAFDRGERIPAERMILFPQRDSNQASQALDGDLGTAWKRVKPAGEVDSVLIDFKREVRGNTFLFLPGQTIDEYPVRWSFWISRDGLRYRKVQEVSDYLRTSLWFGPFPRLSLEGIMEVNLPPEPYRYLKIHQPPEGFDRPWTISEILAYETRPAEGLRPKEETDLAPLVRHLHSNRIRRIHTYDPLAARISLLTKGQIQGAIKYRRLGEVTPDPSAPEHLDAVERRQFRLEQLPAIIVREEDLRRLEAVFRDGGYEWKVQRICSLAVVRPLKRRWQEVSVLFNSQPVAFPGDREALKALDGDLRTRWTPDHPQRPGDVFLLDLGREVRLDYVQLLSGEFSNDYPRGLRIDVSRDGKRWEPVPVRPVPQRLYFINGEMIANHYGENNPIYDVRSVRGPFRCLKFTLTRSDPTWWWSIAEVKLFRDPGER